MILLKNPVKMHIVTKDIAIGFWEDFLFTKFLSDVDTTVANRVAGALHQLSARYPRVKLVTLISEHAAVPSPDARQIMVSAMGKVNIDASGAIFEGAGFRAGAIRGVITALYAVTHSKWPQKICNDVRSCSQWITSICQQNGASLNSEELLAALESFQKKIADAS